MTIELDTIPDLLNYLNVRKAIIENHLIGDVHDLDLLALHKKDPYVLLDLINKGEKSKLVIESGVWESYLKNFSEQILRRNDLNSESYFIDAILSGSHRSIGYEYQGPPEIFDQILGQDAASHFQIATRLAAITRIHRRGLGRALQTCILRAEAKHRSGQPPFAFRVLLSEDDKNSGSVILATEETKISRQERGRFLYNLCSAAGVSFGLTSVLGIATESASSQFRSEDIIVMEDFDFSPQGLEEYNQLAEKMFGTKKHSTDYEFDS